MSGHHLLQQCWVSGKQEAQCGLQASASCISPFPQLGICLSSLHLHLLHSFSFPHSRFRLFFNKLFLIYFFVCFSALCYTCLIFFVPTTSLVLVARSAKIYPVAFVAYLKPFSSLQQCSSSLSCYTSAFFGYCFAISLICLFTPSFFQEISTVHGTFSWISHKCPSLLLIASDNALKILFSTFIIITSLLSSLLEFTSGLCATQLPNFIGFICGRTVSAGTSVAMLIHPLQLAQDQQLHVFLWATITAMCSMSWCEGTQQAVCSLAKQKTTPNQLKDAAR